MSDNPSGTSGVSDTEGTAKGKEQARGVDDGAVSGTSGAVSRASAGTSTDLTSASTTTISTIAVQSGNTKIVLALLQSGEWLELRVVELSPGLVYLGSTLEEATALQEAHYEVLTKLQSKQSPVEDLLNQADQLIATQRPRAEVYAAMAESLGLAWKDLNAHLETRKELLDLSVAFHTRARQYSDALDAAERAYTDNVMPSDAEGARKLLTMLHDHKRAILESSMFTLQEAHALLGRLRGFLQEGASMDSRPQHLRINVEFACSQIEHHLESLHDRRRFMDGLFVNRKNHLEQCLALCLLYQDLTEAVLKMKRLRDEISEHQDLGSSQSNAEILFHEHLRRENAVKAQRDQCLRHVRTAEQMVANGHYAGAEARARAYSVLEAAAALHETCDTRKALLQQAGLFFKLANTALTKIDQAEVQVAGVETEKGTTQRFSLIMGVVEEAVQPALAEGYALLEVTGGRGQSHNEGITDMVEQLENRRTRLSSLCASSTEAVLQRTELLNSFLEMYNSIESWLVRIGDSFLQGHQDPGGSLSLGKDFLHLHLTLKSDLHDKNLEINSLNSFLEQLNQELPEDEVAAHKKKLEDLRHHWTSIKDILESRIALIDKYVKFLEDAELLQNEFEELENLLKTTSIEADKKPIEEKWQTIQYMYLGLQEFGKDFTVAARESKDPYLDLNRAILCVENILESLGKRKLVITDLHSHFQMKITINKELTALWNTYRENLKKMEKEMQHLEDNLCPLLRGDSGDPESMALSLETRLNNYVRSVKKIQEDIENMVTKAEGMAYRDDSGADRPAVVRSLLQLYQNLQNKATDYQILCTMLAQWCRNMAEINRSCDKLESQFNVVVVDVGGVEYQLKEHEATKHAISELLNFARHEADSIIQKIKSQCPRESGLKDIARMEEMLEARRKVMDETWAQRQIVLEKQLKRSQYQVDLKIIKDQLRDLSDQLNRMKGHYGDNLNSALNMKTAFNQFKLTVETLERRIDNFVSTAERMLATDADATAVRMELNDLQNKWSTFHMQVGQAQKSIELSIEFFKLIQDAEDWFKEGSQLLVSVAGESSRIQNPEQALKLRQRIESFVTPGEAAQRNRISKISLLAIELYGAVTPQQVEAVAQQNRYMLDSFNIINQNLTALMESLKAAEQQRYNHEKEQQNLVHSLAVAQAEAEAARLAAAAAEEARRAAEEAAKALPVQTIVQTEKVEVNVQTDAILFPTEEPARVEELPPLKKVKVIKLEPEKLPPVFLTPLVGATVSEGVKFTFECSITGYPVPQVEWLKDGLSIMENPDYRTSFQEGVCSLTIEETFTEDSAYFTCRAVNESGYAETSANLTVKEAAPTEVLSPPTFTKRLVDAFSKEQSSFKYEATVEGHPLPVVTWFKDGVCIDDNPDFIITYNNGECVLRIEELAVQNEGEYECRAFNDLGDDVTKARLAVAASVLSEPPYFPVPLSNLMARAGQKFKLECQVSGVPPPMLTWLHNGKPVKETSECKIFYDGSLASLVISEAFPKNAGQYTLIAQNMSGEAYTSSSVSVKGRIPTETSDSEMTSDIDAEPVKPTVQQPLQDTSVDEGQSVRLDCIIVGQPEPEVIWYHDEKPVKESEDLRLLFRGDRCSLVIQEAFVEDAGAYRVVAMNSAGEAATSCSLSVQAAPEKAPSPQPLHEEEALPAAQPVVAPKFSLLLVDSHVIEGQQVNLTACVTGSPKPTIAWFRDGFPLLPDDQVQIYEDEDGVAKVYIPQATLDHTGQYEVVAFNSAGTAKCVGFLSIEPRLPTPPPPEPTNPPEFTKLLQDVTVTSDDTVNFEAAVTGKPKPSVFWSLNDSRLTEQDYTQGIKLYDFAEGPEGTYSLKMNSISMVQAGRLAIVAENEAGKAVSACHLSVVDLPKATVPPVPEDIERRTIVSETHVTKFVSSSVVEEGPAQKSYSESSTSYYTSSTGQPPVEVHGSRVEQVSQEGTSAPEVSEKVNLIKVEGEKITEQVCIDSTTVPSPLTAKKVVLKRRSTPARFLVPLQGVIVQENDNVSFEAAIDGYPDPTVEWSHNGGPIPSDAVTTHELNKVTLHIPRVTQTHGGRYTCSLDNEAGSAQCTCDLVVRKKQFPPVFSKRLQPSVIGVGERLHLEVDITGTPTPDIQWTKNGQELVSGDSLIIKAEGSRHWLVVPEAAESDSGRYGITASNSAGRAECLADVLVTKLLLSEPQHTVVFRDLSDDTRPEQLLSEVRPSELSVSQEPVQEYEVPFQKEERPLPRKLKLAWPPPPSSEEISETAKFDSPIEITKHKVSSIISSFSSVVDTESPTAVKKFQPAVVDKSSVEEVTVTPLLPEPEPEYGYIEVVPAQKYEKQPYQEEQVYISEEHDGYLPPEIETDREKSLTPEVCFEDLSDTAPSVSLTSDYYPKTSPSIELDSVGKPQSSLLLSVKDDSASDISDKPKEEEESMEVKTERQVRESSFTEIKKSVTTSEKTLTETKVYRDYPDELQLPAGEKPQAVREEEVSHEVTEYVVPESEQVIEFIPADKSQDTELYLFEEDSKETTEDIPCTSPPAEGPFIAHSYSAKESSFASSLQESHATYVSSSEVETKIFSTQQAGPVFATLAQPQRTFEKKVADDLTSGDEAKPPMTPDDKLERKVKRKRESVRQIAMRLEENIAPISPDEIPGGIRMFPPKPPTPSVETPQPTFGPKEKEETMEEISEEKISFEKFPELQPFPFTVEENVTTERPKVPPPPKPKKFIPGTFTDSEYESDFDVSVPEKFVPKKVHFEAVTKTKRTEASETAAPLPPTSFDTPPKFEKMRPEILTDKFLTSVTEPTEKPKEVVPKKKPKIVQKFLAKAGQHAEIEVTSPTPPKGTSATKDHLFSLRQTYMVDESKHEEAIYTSVPPTLGKISKPWPPPQEEPIEHKESTVMEHELPVDKDIAYSIEVQPVFVHEPASISVLETQGVVHEPVLPPAAESKDLHEAQWLKSQSVSEFRSVQAPSFEIKKVQSPLISSDLPFAPGQITSHKEVSSLATKSVHTETKRITQAKSFVSAKKQTTSWPPKAEEAQLLIAPWSEGRSQSLERPPVTEAPMLPPRPHEAPPAIYWSSSISLKEKRSSLPLSLVARPEVLANLVDQQITAQSSLQNIHETSKTSTTIEQLQKQQIVPKHVRIDDTAAPGLPLRTQVHLRKPTPRPSPIKSPTGDAEKSVDYGFRPVPQGEPFPFQVPKPKVSHRERGAPPPKPSKFVPGTFTESDYDSDYEGKPAVVWRPYMSDTETVTSYRPVKVKLRQGRQRKPKVPSPPPPSKFDSKVVLPLRPAFSLSDLDQEIPTPKEVVPVHTAPTIVKPLPITKFAPKISPQLKAVTSAQPAPPSVKRTEPLYTQVTQEVKEVKPITSEEKKYTKVISSVRGKFETPTSVSGFQQVPHDLKGIPTYAVRSASLSPVRNGPVFPAPTVAAPTRQRFFTPVQTQQSSAFRQVSTASQSQTLISSSVPDVSIEKDAAVGMQDWQLNRGIQPAKPPSPKSKKKLNAIQAPKEIEESGYTADTESTLPRRMQRAHEHVEATGTSSSYAKTESYSSTYAAQTSKSLDTAHSAYSSTQGFPTGFGDGGGFPPTSGGPSDLFSFPSFPSSAVGQTTRTSSSVTSESKSSQVYSTTRSEEFYERRSDVHKDSRDETKDIKGTRQSRPDEERRKDYGKPKFEEFRKETSGTPHSYGPYSEDSFYSMHDEKEEVMDGRKKKTKVEMKKESHVQVMSDKKSEFYSYSSGDNLEKPKKESPKSKKKKISKLQTESPPQLSTYKPVTVKPVSEIKSSKSREIPIHLETSAYKDFPRTEKILQPKIEFPDSEPEVREQETLKAVKKGVRLKPEPPKIVAKEPLVLKSQPPKKSEVRRPVSPPLTREPPPEEGYIKPETYQHYPNGYGVESTKVTKIEDSSQYHKRFVTMEQTTRLLKFDGTSPARIKTTMEYEEKPAKVKEIPSIEMKPMPPLEPFPFSPEPERSKRPRGPPPAKPKTFVKGDFRESDYDSDVDAKIRPKWQPQDSDVDEPSFGKVTAPKGGRHRVSSKERTPTPPTVFDQPPPTGEPLRPTIEPVIAVLYREPSPEFVIPTEVTPVKVKKVAKTMQPKLIKEKKPAREPSPPLPSPGPEPEIGITERTEYMVNGVNLETKVVPSTVKSVPSVKKKPYREITEKTEKKITDKQYREEKKLTTRKIETIKTTVTELKMDDKPVTEIDYKTTSDLEQYSRLEPFPFEADKPKPRRERGPPPPQPKKFVKSELSDADYESDTNIKFLPKWKPSDSDTEDLHYSKLKVAFPEGRRPKKEGRMPTPPSEFDTGPLETGPLRPSLDEAMKDVRPAIQSEAKMKISEYITTVDTDTDAKVTFLEPGSEPEVGYIPPRKVVYEKVQEETREKTLDKQPVAGIDIDIDIVDIYDYMSESELEKSTYDVGQYKPVSELQPFPYSPEPQRPRRERGPPPPTPKKFIKGEFRESDYESDHDSRIPPKWYPTDSEGEGFVYRKVQPPSEDIQRRRSESTGRVPSPPSKFDQPPHFEGPPRPVVDVSDIPRRERRESLEEYSMPKFPKVEFKPFDLDEADVHPRAALATDTDLQKQSYLKPDDKRYVKTAQKYVGEQFGDMHQTFRTKAQKFAEQLVSEVFAEKQATGEEITEPRDKKPFVETSVITADRPKLDELGLDQPQVYRDESRISEFGSKHIDPDTGLIYFKYDFGYEFGIIFPGEGKKIVKRQKFPHGKQNGDIEIPVMHFYSDDESRKMSGTSDTGREERAKQFRGEPYDKSGTSEASEAEEVYRKYRGKVIPEFVPKKKAQFRPIRGEPYSDSEKEVDSKRRSVPWAKDLKKGFISVLPKTAMRDSSGGSTSKPNVHFSHFGGSQTSKAPSFITPLEDAVTVCGESLCLECVVRTDLRPKVMWHRNDIAINEGPRCKMMFRNGICRLIMNHLTPEDSGHYSCTVENALGKDSTSASVLVSSGEVS